jgi:AAA domain
MAQPTFVLIFGPPAVGKLAVARELARRTGFGLTHNHVAIEAALPLFDFGTEEYRRLVFKLRCDIYAAAAASDLSGIVGTFVWNFASSRSQEMVDCWCEIFRQRGWRIVFVELKARLETRLRRNRTPDRALGKASKLDPTVSEAILVANERDWLMVAPGSHVMVPPANQWMSLATDTMTPAAVTDRILDDARLPVRSPAAG